MNILNKILGRLTLLTGIILFICGCNDSKYGIINNGAYIKEALSKSSELITINPEGTTLSKLTIQQANLSSSQSKYKLVIDTKLLESYNKLNGTNYLVLPESQYELPNEIIIKAGEYFTDNLSIGFNAFTHELNSSGEQYALPLKLQTEDGSVSAMDHTGSYILIANSISKFSVPEFDGAADINCKLFGSKPLNTNEYTVEVRFQVSNTSARNRFIFINSGDSFNEILLRFEDPQKDQEDFKRHSLVQVVGRDVYLNPTLSFQPNKWQHLALTCDGSNYRLYVNGVFAGVKEIATGPTAFAQEITWLTGQYWRNAKAMINEARIWSTCRTESQIQNTMLSTSPKSPGLEAYWKFDEGEGNTFKDYTGNGYTLTTEKECKWIHGVLSTDESTPWN